MKRIFTLLMLLSVLALSLPQGAALTAQAAAPRKPAQAAARRVTKISLSCGKKTLVKGQTTQITPKLSKKQAKTYRIRYKSSNPKVACVSKKGKVTALATGKATITCTDTKSGAQGKVTIQVERKKKTAAPTKTPQKTATPKPQITPTPKPTSTPKPTGTPKPDAGQNENALDEVLRLVNQERAKQGRSALKANAHLAQGAQVRAKEIATSFSHTRPDGKSFHTAVTQGSFSGFGENIAYGSGTYNTPASVMKGWMDSSGHRANILNSSFDTLGVGLYIKGNTYYWVQIFGRSR